MHKTKQILVVLLGIYILGTIGANNYSVVPIGQVIARMGLGVFGYLALISVVNLAEHFAKVGKEFTEKKEFLEA